MSTSNDFKSAEERYYEARGRLAHGRLTQAQFAEAVRALRVRDGQGRTWRLTENGQWQVFQAQAWIDASPDAPIAPPALPESRPELPLPEFRPGLSLPKSSSAPSLPEIPGAIAGPPSAIRHSPSAIRHPPSPVVRRPSALLWVALMLFVLLAGVALVLAGLALNQGAVALLPPTSAPVAVSNTATATPTAAQTPAASLAPTPPTPTLRPQLPTATPALAVSNVPGTKVSVVAVPTPAPLAAKDFAALNATLGQKIAALNQSELKFIQDMKAAALSRKPAGLAIPPSALNPLADGDLKDIAAKSMDTALLAKDMGALAAKQDGGSAKAQQAAEPYNAIARSGFALVVDAQNLRSGLQSNTITGAQASDTIASYGAQLWNNSATVGAAVTNPFVPLTKSVEASQPLVAAAAAPFQAQANSGAGATWIAQSGTPGTRTLVLPPATSPVANPFDSKVQAALTTAAGQTDGNAAQQVASANLQQLGAQPSTSDPAKPAQLKVPVSAVAGADQVKAGNVPSFALGKATIVSQPNPNDDPFMQSVGLNGTNPPSDQGKTPVQDAPALVSLTLSGFVIKSVNKRPKGSGAFDAEVQFGFTVNWSTGLNSPQFTIRCNSGLNNAITQANGSLNLNASGMLILYPGNLNVYCYANSANEQSLGSASASVLVGDAADATTRAIQVETEFAIQNITLTAEAQRTLNAQQTQTAAAQQTQTAAANATANAQKTIDAVSTEVAGTATAEFKLTAAAFATKQAQPPPPPPLPSATPTFTPKVIDNVFHKGNVMSVQTGVTLQRGRLYRFTFGGRVNLINPTRSVSANQLPEHVNGVTVPASGIVVIEGTGGKATISCGSGEPDPKDPGGYSVTVEDLGPA